MLLKLEVRLVSYSFRLMSFKVWTSGQEKSQGELDTDGVLENIVNRTFLTL